MKSNKFGDVITSPKNSKHFTKNNEMLSQSKILKSSSDRIQRSHISSEIANRETHKFVPEGQHERIFRVRSAGSERSL